jgi:hypothetical protein
MQYEYLYDLHLHGWNINKLDSVALLSVSQYRGTVKVTGKSHWEVQ